MLSRVADAIYWIFRYVERTENVARFIDVNLHLMLDMPADKSAQWMPLVTVTGDDNWFFENYDYASQENVIHFLTFDTDYHSSILSCVYMARENARSVREIISSEMWEQINRFYLMVRNASESEQVLREPHQFLKEVKTQSHLLTGLTEVTMSHGEGWHFARMGALIERADKTSRILDVKYFILLPEAEYVNTPYDNIQWTAVLKSASAFEMYRKRFHRISPRSVADFLIFDREFPRAIRFCVGNAEESLHAITGSPSGTFPTHVERCLGRVRSDLDYGDIDEVIGRGMHEYLDQLQYNLNEFGGAMNAAFFGY
jgi:uncharacterized alpha-E superfamily protein